MRWALLGLMPVLLSVLLAGCSDEPKPPKDPLAAWQPDLDEPIAEMENLLQTLNQQKHINRVAANLAVLYDAKLYQLYLQQHAGLSGEARQEFEQEQRQWLRKRERTAREASDQFRSGSIASFIGSQAFIDETRLRTEALAVRGQKK
jgi:uncharacterized protein YecT (DUF1311 family)